MRKVFILALLTLFALPCHAYTAYPSLAAGGGNSGLTTGSVIGYTVLGADGVTVATARTTTGIVELGNGSYAIPAGITVPDGSTYYVKWDRSDTSTLLGAAPTSATSYAYTLQTNQTTMLSNQTAITNKLGTPSGASVSADIASVKVGVGTVATVTGNVNGSLGGNVQGSVNSVATGVTLASGEHTNIVTDTTNALTAQGYTLARAGKLDYLDVATSTRSTYAGGDTPGTTTLLANQTTNTSTVNAIKAKTDLIATNAGDSPNAVTAQGGVTTLQTRLPQALVFTGPNVNSAAQNLPTDYALRGVSPAWYSDYGSLIAAIKAATDKLAFDNASRVKAVLPPSAH